MSNVAGTAVRNDRSDILYVTYDGLLEPLGASQVVATVERLAARGFSIEVLSFEKPGDLADTGRKSRLGERLRAVGVRWTTRRYHSRPSAPATLYDVAIGIAAGLQWARRSAVGSHRSVVLVHARSYVAGLIGLALKRAIGARLVFDARGFLIDERVESGMWRKGSAVVRGIRAVERRLLQRSDAIVLLAQRGTEVLDSLSLGGRRAPVHVIPPGTDLAAFRPAADPAAARAALGLPQAATVVHIGALSTWYLGEATFAIGKSFARQSGGRFVVLTRELEEAKRLESRTSAGALIRAVEYSEIPQWLAAADAGLAVVRPGLGKLASRPIKVGEYLACGLAVAATPIGDLAEQLAGSEVAFTFDPEEPPDTVAQRLLRAVELPGRIRQARAIAESHFSLDQTVDAYVALYGELGMLPSRSAAPFGAREAS